MPWSFVLPTAMWYESFEKVGQMGNGTKLSLTRTNAMDKPHHGECDRTQLTYKCNGQTSSRWVWPNTIDFLAILVSFVFVSLSALFFGIEREYIYLLQGFFFLEKIPQGLLGPKLIQTTKHQTFSAHLFSSSRSALQPSRKPLFKKATAVPNRPKRNFCR